MISKILKYPKMTNNEKQQTIKVMIKNKNNIKQRKTISLQQVVQQGLKYQPFNGQCPIKLGYCQYKSLDCQKCCLVILRFELRYFNIIITADMFRSLQHLCPLRTFQRSFFFSLVRLQSKIKYKSVYLNAGEIRNVARIKMERFQIFLETLARMT